MQGSDPMPKVFDELRRLASAQLGRQASGHTLQATALVNEAWLKLAARPNLVFEDRAAYLSLASRVMRQILIDHARSRRRQKRGGGRQRVTLAVAEAADSPLQVDVLALHEALQELATLNAERVRLVELRFFGGLTEVETAEVLGLSRRQTQHAWKLARAFLQRELERDAGG